MEKRRVVLFCEEHLFGEILVYILSSLDDVELAGTWSFERGLLPDLVEIKPDLVMIADEYPHSDLVDGLTMQLLQNYPNLPITRVYLERNTLQVYTSQVLPAHVAELVEIIHQVPLSKLGV